VSQVASKNLVLDCVSIRKSFFVSFFVFLSLLEYGFTRLSSPFQKGASSCTKKIKFGIALYRVMGKGGRIYTGADVVLVLMLRQGGMSYRDIASRCRISPATVQRIVETYSDLLMEDIVSLIAKANKLVLTKAAKAETRKKTEEAL